MHQNRDFTGSSVSDIQVILSLMCSANTVHESTFSLFVCFKNMGI